MSRLHQDHSNPRRRGTSLADIKKAAELHQENPGKEVGNHGNFNNININTNGSRNINGNGNERQRLRKFPQFKQGLKARPRPIATYGVLSPSSAAPMVHPFQRHSTVSLSLINPLGPRIHSIRNQRSMRPGAPVGLPSRVITA
jgi:hypothetical protein